MYEYRKQYRKEHKELYRESDKKHYEKNKEKINLKHKEYAKYRRENDSCFKLKDNVRKLIRNSFNRKNEIKNQKTQNILGCNIEFFIKYLLNTYKDRYGMEWDGKEKVHIDHIIPLAIADTEEEIFELCNYKNLQLLKAKDNLQKSCKI